MSIRDYFYEIDEEFLFADGPEFDAAIIGHVAVAGRRDVVLYDREKFIKILMANMSQEDAEEYFEYNVQSAYVGEATPAFATLLENRNE